MSRVAGLIKKYEAGILHEPISLVQENLGANLLSVAQKTIDHAEEHLDNYEFAKASRVVANLSSALNAWLQQHEPWKVDDSDHRRDILWQSCLVLNVLSILLVPLTPGLALSIRQALGLSEEARWEDLFVVVNRFEVDLQGPVFMRIEIEKRSNGAIKTNS